MNKGIFLAAICLTLSTVSGASGGVAGDSQVIIRDGNSTVQGRLLSNADLKDKRLAVLLGSVQDVYASKSYPRRNLFQYNSPSDMLLAVKTGSVDAALYDREALIDILRKDPSLGIVGDSLFSVPVGIGFNRNNSALRDRFNQFLKQIRQDGVYADMVDRWMTKGDTRMPVIPSRPDGGVLVIGVVSDIGVPFSLMQDNKLTGFDIEIAKRFAAFLGKEAKLQDMVFGGLIAAVSTGKIDMIASCMSITEERKKQIIFSDSYYETGTVAIALKKNIAAPDMSAGGKNSTPSLFKRLESSFHSNIIHEQRYFLILDGLKTTIVISIFSTLLGTLLGGGICFLRMSKSALLNIPASVYISIVRGTPLLVLLMLIFYVVFAAIDIDPVLVSVIAFGINFAAYVAEIFRAGIESIDRGQSEAGIAMGFSRVATFRHIILPQTVRRILPVYKGEMISLVKMTSIVGYIAVQDLTKASDIIRSRTFDAFFPLLMVAVLYFLISWLLMRLLGAVERMVDPKLAAARVKAAQAVVS